MRRGVESANGYENCDFRGERYVGAPDDHHATIPQLEIDPATDEQIAQVLEHGPMINRLFGELFGKKLDEAIPDQIEELTGGGTYPRIGVWDE